jgi:hypothetical protein
MSASRSGRLSTGVMVLSEIIPDCPLTYEAGVRDKSLHEDKEPIHDKNKQKLAWLHRSNPQLSFYSDCEKSRGQRSMVSGEWKETEC